MTPEKLSERMKHPQNYPDFNILQEIEVLEAERDTLLITLKDIDHLRLQNFERAESAEAEVKALKEQTLIDKNQRLAFSKTLHETQARLAKAQEHIKVAEKFVRDEDWSDYLSAVEEKEELSDLLHEVIDYNDDTLPRIRKALHIETE